MRRTYAEAGNAAAADLAVLWAEAAAVMALRMWMLGLGLAPTTVMLFACGPGLVTAALVLALGWHRRGR